MIPCTHRFDSSMDSMTLGNVREIAGKRYYSDTLHLGAVCGRCGIFRSGPSGLKVLSLVDNPNVVINRLNREPPKWAEDHQYEQA